MYRTLLLLYSFLFCSCIVAGQNLVPNYSFEDTVACPPSLAHMNYAIGWSDFKESPDYLNVCAPDGGFSNASVPHNSWGFQYPKTGNAYSGLTTFSVFVGFREYMGIQLIQPLVIGVKYFGSFYISRAEQMRIATNKIGMLMSTQQFTFANPASIRNYAHIYTDSIITDTIAWTKISGSFIADSAYQYLMIGNFFADSLTTKLFLDSTALYSYYYIDDVFLSTDSTIGISEITNHNSEITLYPNPTTSTITLSSPTSFMHTPFSIYNSLGEKIFTSSISSTHQTIHLPAAAGVYFLKVEGENFVQKLIIY